MRLKIRLQLSLMMFFNFFIWGAWFVTMGTFLKTELKATDLQIGLAYSTQSLGAILAPFIIGLIADKYFAAQKILGFLHIAGACLMYYASTLNNFAFFLSCIAYVYDYLYANISTRKFYIIQTNA